MEEEGRSCGDCGDQAAEQERTKHTQFKVPGDGQTSGTMAAWLLAKVSVFPARHSLQSSSMSGSPLGPLTPTWLRIGQLCKADPLIFLRQLLVLPGLSSIWKTRALCTVRSELGT